MTTQSPPKLKKPVVVGLIISAVLLITAVLLEVHNWTEREGIRMVQFAPGSKDPMLQAASPQARMPDEGPGEAATQPVTPPHLVPPLGTPPDTVPQTPEGLAAEGLAVVTQFKCLTCHTNDGRALISTSFKNLYGKQSKLVDGRTVTVDDAYIRESILDPQAKIVEGPKVPMASYKGQLSEQQIQAVIAYIKSISAAQEAPGEKK